MDKKDLMLIVILTLMGIISIWGGWNIVSSVALNEELSDVMMKIQTVPGWALMLVGGCDIYLMISLVYQEVTGKLPWWIVK